MTRRLLFLIAAVIAGLVLTLGAVLTPAHASQPSTPIVKVATSSRPLTCIIGLGKHAVCLTLS